MQIRNFAFHDLDTAQAHNLRFLNVVRAGVYRGFRIRRNAGDPTLVDLTHGSDSVSVLVTSEGVRIQETAETIGVLRFEPADTNYARWDLVVAEYQWSPNPSIQQTYKIIKGRYPRVPGDEPVKPIVQNPYQVPLAYVYVRALSALGGTARVEIRQEDIVHVAKADWVEAPGGMDCLKPVIDPTDPKRIFVYPGRFPSQSGVGYIDFQGGYSEELDDTGMVDGDVAYFLFGVTDDSLVSVAAKDTVPSLMVDIGTDVLPLCVGKAVKQGGSTTLTELIDVRFPFSRRFVPKQEEDFYLDDLGNNVFDYLRLDPLRDETFIDLASIAPVDANLTAKIVAGETALELKWAGTGDPAADVTIATKNLLDNAEGVTNLRHIMLVIDTDVENLTFDYSATSGYSGFTGRDYRADSIVELPGGVNQLFLKFKVPASEFSGGAAKKIFSYAVFMVLDYATLNDQTFSMLGVENLNNCIPNLIPNGDFQVWSRPATDGFYPDPNSRNKILYEVVPGGLADKTKIFAADGWQFTKFDFPAYGGTISRALWSRDALGSVDINTMDTALGWVGLEGGSLAGAQNYLEYRVPAFPDYSGRFVTFAFDFMTSPREALGIRVVLYERNEDGTLKVQSAAQSGAPLVSGTLVIKSASAINEKTYAIGFIIVFQQTTGRSTVWVRRARAAIGAYDELTFTKPQNAKDLIRAWYEVGVAMTSASVEQGEEIGTGFQFGAVKHDGLSDGGVRVKETGAVSSNRNVNLGQFALSCTRNGGVARGAAMITGLAVIDVDWEAAVVYPAV